MEPLLSLEPVIVKQHSWLVRWKTPSKPVPCTFPVSLELIRDATSQAHATSQTDESIDAIHQRTHFLLREGLSISNVIERRRFLALQLCPPTLRMCIHRDLSKALHAKLLKAMFRKFANFVN
jgi:hypothetical protein